MVSVVIPVYNAEKYIERCMDSIVNQDMKDIEIIVIDDGSTDASLSKCLEYQAKDERVKVITQANKGPTVARKQGVKKAVGEYIVFVDADDHIEKDMLTSLVREIEGTDYDFVHTGFYDGSHNRVIGSLDEIFLLDSMEEKVGVICGYILNAETSRIVSPSMWSKIYKKDFIKKCFSKVPDRLYFGEDLYLLCLSVFECRSIKCINKAYYRYENNTASITHEVGINRIKQIVELCEELKKLFDCYSDSSFLREALEGYFTWTVSSYISRMTGYVINRYKLLDIEMYYGKRIVIYGAGQVGQDIYAQISKYQNIDIAAWVDADSNKAFDYYKLCSPEEITEKEFDYIIIAIKDNIIAAEVKNRLIDAGIERKRIVEGKIGVWT